MQYVRGKLAKIDDLFILLDVLKEKTGEVRIYLPIQELEVSICYDGAQFHVHSEEENPKLHLTKLLEEWLTSKVQPTFELYEGKECPGSLLLTEGELRALIEGPRRRKVYQIPEAFEITKIEIDRAPSFLIAHWKARKPVTKKELYRHNITLSQVAQLIDEGALKIRVFRAVESLPFKLRALLMAAAVVCLIYLLLPLNFLHLNVLKFNEALNWGLKEKILGTEKTVKLPVKGCFSTRFYLHEDKVVNLGLDGKLGSRDDKSIELPKKGYIPTFTVPAK